MRSVVVSLYCDLGSKHHCKKSKSRGVKDSDELSEVSKGACEEASQKDWGWETCKRRTSNWGLLERERYTDTSTKEGC